MQKSKEPKEPKEEKKSKIGLSAKELKDILTDKANWADAAHWGLNEVLEKTAPVGGRGAVTKFLGAPAELLKIGAEAAWILSSPERMAENKKGMEELADTSASNRLISGYTNTAQNLIGFSQHMKEGIDSERAARESVKGYSKALNESAMKTVWEVEKMLQDRIDQKKEAETKKMLAEEVKKRELEMESRRKGLEEMKRALDPDFDLEERTMGLVKGITRRDQG